MPLKPLEERKLDADHVIGRIRKGAALIPGANLFLQPVQDLRIGGRSSSSQYQFALQGENLAELNEWAPRLMERLKTLPGIVDVTSDQLNRGLQTTLEIDRSTASRLGI